MQNFKNSYKLPVVESFLRLYEDALVRKFDEMRELAADVKPLPDTIEFLPLADAENEYDDVVVRLGNKIYISEKMTGQMGFSYLELFAVLAHELGHILYRTHPWGFDAEERADSLAAELGLATQMISVIEKIIASRRFRQITSALVRRIQFLQLIA